MSTNVHTRFPIIGPYEIEQPCTKMVSMKKPACSHTKNRAFIRPHPVEAHPSNRAAIKMCQACPLLQECAVDALHAGTTLTNQEAPADHVIQAGVICHGDYTTAMQLAMVAGVEVPAYREQARRNFITDGDLCLGCEKPLFRWTRGQIPAGYAPHHARGYCTYCRAEYRAAHPPAPQRLRKPQDAHRGTAPPRHARVEPVQLTLNLKETA